MVINYHTSPPTAIYFPLQRWAAGRTVLLFSPLPRIGAASTTPHRSPAVGHETSTAYRIAVRKPTCRAEAQRAEPEAWQDKKHGKIVIPARGIAARKRPQRTGIPAKNGLPAAPLFLAVSRYADACQILVSCDNKTRIIVKGDRLEKVVDTVHTSTETG